MATIKKTEKVKITYDKSKITLTSNSIDIAVDMSMSQLMAVYASGTGEGNATYLIKVPDSIVSPPASPVVEKSESILEPIVKPSALNTEEIPIVVVEKDKEEPVPVATEELPPVENIDDIIREAETGEVTVTASEPEPDKEEPVPVITETPVESEPDKEEPVSNDGWESVDDKPEAETAEEVTHDQKDEDEPRETKYRGFASKSGFTDTP